MADEPVVPPLPTADEEFTFKDLDSCPAWVDKNWASYSHGPALALPVDLTGKGPYTTKIAEAGDKVMFIAAAGAMPAHFEVIKADHSLDEGVGTLKPAAASNASLEDLVRLGHLPVGDLGSDAKAQLLDRSPELRDIVEGKTPQQVQDKPLTASP